MPDWKRQVFAPINVLLGDDRVFSIPMQLDFVIRLLKGNQLILLFISIRFFRSLLQRFVLFNG